MHNLYNITHAALSITDKQHCELMFMLGKEKRLKAPVSITSLIIVLHSLIQYNLLQARSQLLSKIAFFQGASGNGIQHDNSLFKLSFTKQLLAVLSQWRLFHRQCYDPMVQWNESSSFLCVVIMMPSFYHPLGARERSRERWWETNQSCDLSRDPSLERSISWERPRDLLWEISQKKEILKEKGLVWAISFFPERERDSKRAISWARDQSGDC